jgi:hypothetical protein
MKKKVLSVMFITAVAVGAGWNVGQSVSDTFLSDVALNGMEAMASEEFTITCSGPNPYGGQCYDVKTEGCGNPWCGCEFSGYQADFCYYG